MTNELYHHGIKGQRWGVRRYQNEDGTLTRAGKKRYSKEFNQKSKKAIEELDSQANKIYIDARNSAANKFNSKIDNFTSEYDKRFPESNDDEYTKAAETYFYEIFRTSLKTAMAENTKKNKNFMDSVDIINKYGDQLINDPEVKHNIAYFVGYFKDALDIQES